MSQQNCSPTSSAPSCHASPTLLALSASIDAITHVSLDDAGGTSEGTSAPSSGTTVAVNPHDIGEALQALHTRVLQSCEHEHRDIMDILRSVLSERVWPFIERQVRILHERRLSREQLRQCVDTVIQKHCSRYLYNPDINGFYIVAANSIKRVSSDVILLQLKERLPDELSSHWNVVLRSVKAHIMQHQRLLHWTPSCVIQARITRAVKSFFDSDDEARFFMSVIGAIANREEERRLATSGHVADHDKPPSDAFSPLHVHLWHGSDVQQSINTFQTLVHNHTGYASPFWSRLRWAEEGRSGQRRADARKSRRRELTNAQLFRYDFRRMWWLHFSPRRPVDRARSQKVLANNPESFLATCSLIFRDTPPHTWETHSIVRRTRNIANSAHFFARYVAQNCVGDDSFLLLEEIVKDVREYLLEHHFPMGVLSKSGLRRCINAQFQRVQVGSRCFFRGALNAPSHYDTFERFATRELVECSEEGGMDTEELFAAYSKWCTLEHETGCTMALLETFLRIKYEENAVTPPMGQVSSHVAPDSGGGGTGDDEDDDTCCKKNAARDSASDSESDTDGDSSDSSDSDRGGSESETMPSATVLSGAEEADVDPHTTSKKIGCGSSTASGGSGCRKRLWKVRLATAAHMATCVYGKWAQLDEESSETPHIPDALIKCDAKLISQELLSIATTQQQSHN